MEQNRTAKNKAVALENQQEDIVKVVQWEDFEQELARLVSLSSALNEAKEKKLVLQQKLDTLIQVKAESLHWSNQLDDMREKLESRKLVMGNMSMHVKAVEENVKKEEKRLSNEIRSLLVAGTALSVASKRLQGAFVGFTLLKSFFCCEVVELVYLRAQTSTDKEANRLLAGERGYVHMRSVQKLLRVRQQHMISRVSLLYPVKVVIGHAYEQELEFFAGSSRSGNSAGSKPIDQGPLTISGLHLTVLPFKKMSFFTDKKEVQRSATALGYVTHAVFLIASYLKVPLRYPLRLGGSRSYIHDYAPSAEPPSSNSGSNLLLSSNLKPTEFPLFLDGQETTRAAYAVFLLNKDIEQLLNFIGVNSLGPRHVLVNLKELLMTILSPEYKDT